MGTAGKGCSLVAMAGLAHYGHRGHRTIGGPSWPRQPLLWQYERPGLSKRIGLD